MSSLFGMPALRAAAIRKTVVGFDPNRVHAGAYLLTNLVQTIVYPEKPTGIRTKGMDIEIGISHARTTRHNHGCSTRMETAIVDWLKRSMWAPR